MASFAASIEASKDSSVRLGSGMDISGALPFPLGILPVRRTKVLSNDHLFLGAGGVDSSSALHIPMVAKQQC